MHSKEKSSKVIFWILYLITGLLVVTLAWIPLEIALAHFIYEDTFYYLKIAQNIVNGLGSSMDGIASTNGYHPLWMLICMAVEKVSPPSQSLHILLTIAAVLHLLQARLIYLIVYQHTQALFAHLAAIFWLFNYKVISSNLCGLETPLATFFVLLISRLIISKKVNGWLLGLLFGLAILSRFDLILFVGVALLFVYLMQNANIKDVLKSVFVATCLLIPWFYISYSISGSLLPNSRAALNVWGFKTFSLESRVYENLLLFRERFFGFIYYSLDVCSALGLWPVPYAIWNKQGGVIFFLFTILLGLAYWGVYRSNLKKNVGFLLLFALVHVGYYALFARIEIRYLLPAIAVLVASTWILMSYYYSRYTGLVKVLAFVLYLNMIIVGWLSWQYQYGSAHHNYLHVSLYNAALWLKGNTPKESVVGGWNSGIVSYFSDRKVVNLDGVVNDKAIEALKKKELGKYLDERGVEYLVDVESEIVKFMDKFSGEQWRNKYEKRETIGNRGESVGLGEGVKEVVEIWQRKKG